MGYREARAYLDAKGMGERVIVFKENTATVHLAALALGCEDRQIAKTMAFWDTGKKPLLIVTAGDTKIDNHKFKTQFGTKATMIRGGELEEAVGHAPGGVCPFGIRDGVEVFLDVSLKRFDTVYPASGDDHTAVRLTPDELAALVPSAQWIDVCRIIDPEA